MPQLALDWWDEALILAWPSTDPIQPIQTVRYPLPPGYVIEGQIKQPEAMAGLIRQVMDEHSLSVTEAVVALGAPFLNHHWLSAVGDARVPSTPVLRMLISKVHAPGSSFDEVAYCYDARREPILTATTDHTSDQETRRWWLVGLPEAMVASLQTMFQWCGLSLARIDVRASVLFRLLAADQAFQDKCCVIDPHGTFTEWWLLDQGKITDLQSYSHARLSEAEQAHYLGERLAKAVATGSIESVWVSQPLSELMHQMLSQSLGIAPQSCLDPASHGTAITTGLLQ